jgi:hypothetical protein
MSVPIILILVSRLGEQSGRHILDVYPGVDDCYNPVYGTANS